MCTLTVIAITPEHQRLVFNRDEQRTRPTSHPPELRRTGPYTTIMPIDPASGGTWLAANDAGLVACLLNANPESSSPRGLTTPRRSRGEIIPALMNSGSMSDAAHQASALNPRDYPPYRLVLMASGAFVVIESDGHHLTSTTARSFREPMLLTSSGLGDAVVEQPRRILFETMLAPHRASPSTQDDFHNHRWPERLQLSVLMSRAEARTVSQTTLDIVSDSITLRHRAVSDPPERNDPTFATRINLTNACIQA